MRITNTKTGFTFDRGNSKAEREMSAAYIMQHVRCRYTPQSKARAKAFAKAFAKANTTV